jgi:hypothetical protein
MTVLTSQQQLELMLANTLQPVLDQDALDTLLADAQIRDTHGRWVDDPDYVETYDLNRAAGKGWRIKAGMVAADYTITVEGRALNRAEMIEHFLTMAKQYEKKAGVRSAKLTDDADRTTLWTR